MASKSMQSNKKPWEDPEPPLQYKHRGQYEAGRITPARLLFVGVRIATLFTLYSILASPASNLSIFNKFPHAYPPKSPVSSTSIPLIPDHLLSNLSERLDLDPNSLIVLCFFILFSIQFTFYTFVWRREMLPLLGDGGSVPVVMVLFIIDLVHVLLYLYTSAINPTWSLSLFRWTPLFFLAGFAIQFWSDQTKHLFKTDPRNKGKVLKEGLWAIVRHPNYTGYLLWRIALATAVGGWAFGLLSAWVHTKAATDASIPSIELHMQKTYGKQWDAAKEKVRWKLIPFIY